MALLLLLSVPISFVVALNYVAARALLAGAPKSPPSPVRSATRSGCSSSACIPMAFLAVEIFFGLWLLPFGLLVIRSRFLPRVLGILLIIAGVAYIAHSVTSLLLAGHRIILYERVTMLARAAGEFPIMLWLLTKGADVRPGALERLNRHGISTTLVATVTRGVNDHEIGFTKRDRAHTSLHR